MDKNPVCVKEPQFSVLTTAFCTTGWVAVQDWPPRFKLNDAVPVPFGVPVTSYCREPLPVANEPPSSVAVKPVTPAD
jgi:hypothetical protein